MSSMRSSIPFIIVLLFAACAPAATSDNRPGAAATGLWGGEHVRLELTPAGGAVEYDCAHGGLTEPVRPGSRGDFEARGVHVREHGGPIREGERPDSMPARFVGRIVGDQMTLRVYAGTRPDTLGPFDLRRGSEARVFKCL
jgi:hypothetical protein